MPDYNFAGLCSRSFEQLIQALCAKVFGPKIAIFGDGPDGAREATFDGAVKYGPLDWSGYLVIQAKFLQKPKNRSSDASWLIEQIHGEMAKFLDKKRKLKRPKFYIIATNIELSSVPKTGTKEKVNRILLDYQRKLRFDHFDIWDYDKLRTFLDDARDIAASYGAWITAGDVLAQLVQRLDRPVPDLDSLFATFLKKEMLADQYANLEQAGHHPENQIPLAGVFLDLPSSNAQLYEPDDKQAGFSKEIAEAARDTFRSTDPKSPDQLTRSGRFVLIGGPGQGKTTLGQYICQLFRATCLKGRSRIPREVVHIIAALEIQCKKDQMEFPSTRRFPVRVVLSEFAKAIASKERSISLLSYLAERITQSANQLVTPHDLKEWLAVCPWLLVMDGLDEVPPSSNRAEVLKAIQEFWVDAAESDADILVIATTRPQGYSFEFSPKFYEHRYLVPLSPTSALKYGDRLVEMRYGADIDRKKKVYSRLNRASKESATARLMRTPLQVTIMATLVDKLGQPPQERWSLFREYYNVIYSREVERPIPPARILREHKADVDAIHRSAGLILQAECERTGSTEAKLTTQQFDALVRLRLKSEGHEGEKLDQIAKSIIDAAAQRLVFIVGLEENQVGFEIRSLQEFMAAEGLMDAADETVRERLKQIASLTNWRAVFLFAAGKCYSDRQHLRHVIHALCGELNDDPTDVGSRLTLAGSQLALDLLEDGTPRSQPRHGQSLARLALRLLDMPSAEIISKIAGVYHPDLEIVYKDELISRMRGGSAIERAAATAVAIGISALGNGWVADLVKAALGPAGNVSLEEVVDLTRGVPIQIDILDRIVSRLGAVPPRVTRALLRHSTIESADFRQRKSTRWFRTLASFKGFEEWNLPVPLLSSFDEHLVTITIPSIFQKWESSIDLVPRSSPAWQPDQSLSQFLAKPSSERLANFLRAVAQRGLPQFIFRRPWVIDACILTNRDPARFEELASAAEAGKLGDLPDWVAAETRWRQSVSISEIYDCAAEEFPVSPRIASWGLPSSVFRSYRLTDKRISNATIQRSVEFCRKERSFLAGVLANVCWVLLEHQSFGERAPSQADLAVLLEASAFKNSVVNASRLRWLDGTFRNDRNRFLELAENIGKAKWVYADSPLQAELVEAIASAFVSDPKRESLLKVLSCTVREGSDMPVISPILLLRTYDSVLARTAALEILIIQGNWALSPRELAERVISAQADAEMEQDHFYFSGATLASRASVDQLAQFLAELISSAGSHGATVELLGVLAQVLKKRRSGFSEPMECERLQLGVLREIR